MAEKVLNRGDTVRLPGDKDVIVFNQADVPVEDTSTDLLLPIEQWVAMGSPDQIRLAVEPVEPL